MNKLQWNVLKLMVMSLTLGLSAASLSRNYNIGSAALMMSLLLITISSFHRNFVRPFSERKVEDHQD